MHTLNMHTFNSNGLESLYMNLKIMDFCILYRVKKKKKIQIHEGFKHPSHPN